VKLFVWQVWFQNRRAKWRKNSERLQRSLSDSAGCYFNAAITSLPRLAGATETAELGGRFWLADKSALLSLLAARSSASPRRPDCLVADCRKVLTPVDRI